MKRPLKNNIGNPSGRSGRPINSDKSLAIFLSEKTYRGGIHRKCGTNVRYVSNGGCVHCARVIMTEQREALKYKKQHEAEYLESLKYEDADRNEEPLNDVAMEDTGPIDSELEDGLDTDDPDDAEARRQASIDDLM